MTMFKITNTRYLYMSDDFSLSQNANCFDVDRQQFIETQNNRYTAYAEIIDSKKFPTWVIPYPANHR